MSDLTNGRDSGMHADKGWSPNASSNNVRSTY